MTTALARELTNGIEGEVEDLGAVFKKMAILKPVVDTPADIIEGTATVVEDVASDDVFADEELAAPVILKSATPKPTKPASGLLSLLHTPPKPKRKRKPAPVLENQLSLLDMLENTA
jgi:hypothetical protein